MTVAMGLALYAIIPAYNAQVHQPINAHLAQILFKPKEFILPRRVYVQINILMIPRISFANRVHQRAILVRVIKTHALNV